MRQFFNPALAELAAIASRYGSRMENEGAGGAGDDATIGLTPGASQLKSAGAAFLEKLGKAADKPFERGPDDEPAGGDDDDDDDVDLQAQRASGAGASGDDDDDDDDDDAQGEGRGAAKKKDDDELEDLTEAELEELTDEERTEYEDAIAARDAARTADKAAKGDTLIVLKGHTERGEEDLELEVDDPAIAERIRRLQKDGMRGAQFRARSTEVEARERELEEVEITMATNLNGFLLERIPKESQLGALKALLVEHIADPEVAKLIDGYLEDPMKAREDRLEIRDQAKQAERRTQQHISNREAAREILKATQLLLPEDVAPDVATRFLKDAERDLIDAVREGTRIVPSDVPRLLAQRVKFYGFAASSSSSSRGSSRSTAAARPVSDKAKAIAERAKNEQTRTKANQTARRRAGNIPAGGRGATTVARPLVKKGGGIKEASQAVRKAGITSWDQVSTGRKK